MGEITMRLGAIGLYVSNMEVMVKFYKDVMGLNINWDGGGFTAVEMVGFTLYSKPPLTY